MSTTPTKRNLLAKTGAVILICFDPKSGRVYIWMIKTNRDLHVILVSHSTGMKWNFVVLNYLQGVFKRVEIRTSIITKQRTS